MMQFVEFDSTVDPFVVQVQAPELGLCISHSVEVEHSCCVGRGVSKGYEEIA